MSSSRWIDLAFVRQRIFALFIDWLTISGYLIVLAVIATASFFVYWGEIPQFTSGQGQLIATLTSVVPAIFWFTYKESRPPFASFGKRKQKLRVRYRHNPFISALVRNAFKFLPWQLGHMGVISGIDNNFESMMSIIVCLFSIFLALTYFMQVIVTPSHRHIGDLVAGGRVVPAVGARSRCEIPHIHFGGAFQFSHNQWALISKPRYERSSQAQRFLSSVMQYTFIRANFDRERADQVLA